MSELLKVARMTNMTDNPLRALVDEFERRSKLAPTVAVQIAYQQAAYDLKAALAAPAQDSVACEHAWYPYVQPVYRKIPPIHFGESNIERYENLGRMCGECGKVEASTPSGNAALVALRMFREAKRSAAADAYDGIDQRTRELLELADVAAEHAIAGQAQAIQPQAQEACPHIKGYRSDEGERCAECGEIQYPQAQEAGRWLCGFCRHEYTLDALCCDAQISFRARHGDDDAQR